MGEFFIAGILCAWELAHPGSAIVRVSIGYGGGALATRSVSVFGVLV
jgi:hypothetical protein